MHALSIRSSLFRQYSLLPDFGDDIIIEMWKQTNEMTKNDKVYIRVYYKGKVVCSYGLWG